jgi:hypothetical protein
MKYNIQKGLFLLIRNLLGKISELLTLRKVYFRKTFNLGVILNEVKNPFFVTCYISMDSSPTAQNDTTLFYESGYFDIKFVTP